MKSFQLLKKYFALLGISSTEKPFNLKILKTFLLYTINSSLAWIFLIRETNSFREYIDLIYMTSAMAAIISHFIVLVFEMENLFIFIETMEKIVEIRSEHAKSEAMYKDTNRQIEKWTELTVFVMVKISLVCWITPRVIVSFYLYFTTDLGNDAFELPLAIWLPFDIKNPFVYLIVIIYQGIVAVYNFLLLACIISTGIGLYFLLLAVTMDIKHNLFSINNRARTQENQQQMTFTELSDVIQLQTTSKQIFNEFVQIHRPIFVTLFVWSLITICIAFLMIQMEIEKLQINAVLLRTISMVCFSFGIVFVACEFGQRSRNACDEINDVIDEFDWYLFPNELQKILPFIIHFAQQPVDIEFFGSIACNRNVLKKVINSGFSYFMVLREFSK